jgi:anti-sigma factor (TIGR02949 family)
VIRKTPGMIRCEEAMARLWEFLDGELQDTEETAVQKHLEVCNRCYPRYDFQKAYFEYMQRTSSRERGDVNLRRELFRRLLGQEAGDD